MLGQIIQQELAASRPIGCRIGWSDNTGHYVAISGYHNDGVNEDITVEDPLYGQSHLGLSTFADAYQNTGTWTNTIYTQPQPTV